VLADRGALWRVGPRPWEQDSAFRRDDNASLVTMLTECQLLGGLGHDCQEMIFGFSARMDDLTIECRLLLFHGGGGALCLVPCLTISANGEG
jgi:hypothetical protein